MSIEALLNHLIIIDKFHNDAKAEGIAKCAIDKGFKNLSKKQQAVLNPFLSQRCAGSIDPAGHHDTCQKILTNDELLSAYEESNGDDPQCESCRAQDSYYAYQKARIDSE
ncbi:hypothetical protein [Grimontia hollisae]|uniref:hypothetical protein n=1 Tax=Grimontia hollisae TaxID=673 RepID=UPI00165E7CC9|nr:hypothetical protein [Grimontia hollisae]